ncbi:ATP-binding protein [Streptomyces lunaelactis]|uniref:histidine kinase n=1 Tax=Streptomyces lunaelactis TaxID=1535768 RepID=A0A2R4TBM9_9ACTN|nr:ATP-binding protein [Streptomyces lunaelactis]AVZ76532.1 ATP-binding protein [Streptomyces lunaelactis]NUK82973.1 ATP-binding protein [Streptomyces lunaelactis]
MSQLRAPAARPDRREGGRHGRPGTRSLSSSGKPHPVPSSPEARIRPQLLRTAVLPAVVAALSGMAAVIVAIRSADAQPSTGLWAVLTGSAVLAIASVAAAAVGADRMAKSVLDRCATLRRSTARGQADLRTVVDRLRRGEGPPVRPTSQSAPPGGDEFDLLTEELSRSHEAAVVAVVQASRLSSSVGNEQKVEVFVNLARRLQSLVHREIQLLDELENEVEDPELLKGLFHVDHLATRIRRHAENLAVLGGAMSRRQWSNPVTMTEVLRSAIAEVEQYPRVKLVPPIDGTLRGHAVADVIHLLAELVENATLFSAPHTQVLLRAQHVTAGLAVEVEDRGLGMPADEQHKMNALLADPDQVNVAHMLQDGRIGLFVVSALARRHGIAVRLQSNIYGGVQAILVLPQGLLGTEPGGFSRAEAAPSSSDSATGVQSAVVPTAWVQPAAAAPSIPQQPHSTPEQAPVFRQLQPPLQQQQPQREPVTATLGAGPLPVRGEQSDRPNPAAARPGVSHASLPNQPSPPDHTSPPNHSAPANGSAPANRSAPSENSDGMGRPQLPKRRSQEHLVPQLRDAPAPRKDDDQAIHDPGLMAAFQRGIGLAESQPLADPAAQPQPQHFDNTSKE